MYAKFNGIGDDLSDDDDALVPSSSSSSKQHPDAARARTLLLQHEAMVKLTEWLSVAPNLAEPDATRLIRLFAASDKVANPDSAQRHENVASLLEEAVPGATQWTAPTQVLVALCKVAEHQAAAASEKDDPTEQLACGRAMVLAMGALNIVSACHAEGLTARRLFAVLRDEPSGRVAKQYEKFEYAKARVREGGGGSSGVQEAAAAAAAAEAEDEEQRRRRQAAEAEEQEMREAMAAGFKQAEEAARRFAKEQRAGTTPDKRLDMWMVAKTFWMHGGMIVVALVLRTAWEMWFGPSDAHLATGAARAHDEV